VTAGAVRVSSALLVAGLALVVGCEPAPTAPSAQSIQRERSLWSAHHLSRYAYVYETTGFLINWSGRRIRLVVLNDTVVSAQDLTTDSLLTMPSAFPTLDGLFDRALVALTTGTLSAITFDPTFDFPSRMDLAGPPDASGSILASSLELLP
jgi:hypothetical protein